MRTFRFVVGLSLICAVGCGGRTVPLQTTTSRVIAGAYGLSQVRTAVIRALEERRFQVESENGTQLVAAYERRGRIIQIAVTYTETSFHINYLQSAGFGARMGPQGATVISSRYQRTVDRLVSRIQEELERPAREAREHQIQLAQAQRPVVVTPGVAVAPATTSGGYVSAPSCEVALADVGHPQSSEIFCGGANPWCARELIYQGHAPSSLIFCQNVGADCAVAHLRGGGAPSALIRCH